MSSVFYLNKMSSEHVFTLKTIHHDNRGKKANTCANEILLDKQTLKQYVHKDLHI